MLKSALGAAFLVLLTATVRAEEEPVRLELKAEQIPVGDDWFGVYVQGTKSGWGHATLTKERDQYVSKTVMSISLKAMGQNVTIEIEETKRFAATAPFKFVGGHFKLKQGPIGQEVTVVAAPENQLKAEIVNAGQKREMTVPMPDYALADDLVAMLWIGDRKAGDKIAVRSFELSQLQTSIMTTTVKKIDSAVVHGVPTKHYEVGMHSSLAGDVGTARLGADGQLLSMVFGGMFEMRLETKEVAQKLEEGGDLFIQNFAKPDKPLGDPREVTKLVLSVSGKGAEYMQPGPNQTVEKGADGVVIVKIGVDAPVKATAEELEENLKETVEYPVKHEAIGKLAAAAVAGATTEREKVDRLVVFVSEYVKDEMRPQPLAVLDVVKDRRGDCQEHAILFTTLARSIGIPARTVSGLAYVGDQLQGFGGHAWNEVVLDGHWVPVDPTWKETKIDAAHIRVGTGIKGMTQFSFILGRLKIKVLDIEKNEAGG